MAALQSAIGISTVGLATLASLLPYDHRGRRYAEGKSRPIPSLPGAKAIARLVTWSSVLVGTLAFATDSVLICRIHANDVLLYAGSTLALASRGVFIWAKRVLGDQYSPCFDSFVASRLIAHGPYAWVRHPIYSANLLLLFSLFLACGSLLFIPIALLLFVYYRHAAYAEEAELTNELPGYRDYLASTGRFVPRFF